VPVTLGMSGARVWRLDGTPTVYVKTTEHAHCHDDGTGLAAEAERLAWLASAGVTVPEVVEVGADDQFAWLVTTALNGRTAADPWPQTQRSAVIEVLADIVLALHAVPVGDCPFDRRLAVRVPEALKACADLDDLDEERAGWSAAQLVDALVTTMPTSEDLVVCHGDLCLPNVLLDPETLACAGLVDVGRAGAADRHSDIALMARSIGHEINDQFDPACAQRFLDRYAAGSGVLISSEKLEFYRLLDEFF